MDLFVAKPINKYKYKQYEQFFTLVHTHLNLCINVLLNITLPYFLMLKDRQLFKNIRWLTWLWCFFHLYSSYFDSYLYIFLSTFQYSFFVYDLTLEINVVARTTLLLHWKKLCLEFTEKNEATIFTLCVDLKF